MNQEKNEALQEKGYDYRMRDHRYPWKIRQSFSSGSKKEGRIIVDGRTSFARGQHDVKETHNIEGKDIFLSRAS